MVQRFPWRGPSPEDLADAVVRRVSALVAREGVAMAGAEKLVRDLHGAGALLGLCSSSPMSLVEVVCDRLALTRYFATRRRPRTAREAVPGSLFETARRLGVEAAQCLVVEDSGTGIPLGAAAGMTVVAVGATAASAELCHHAVPGLDAVDAETLLRWQPSAPDGPGGPFRWPAAIDRNVALCA